LPLSVSANKLLTMRSCAEVDCTGVFPPGADTGGSDTIVPPPKTGGSVTVMVWEVATIFPLRISLTANTSDWSPWLVNVIPLLTSAVLNV